MKSIIEGSVGVEIVSWTLIIGLFIIAFVGLIYPIIPSVLFLLGGFIVYGLFNSFSELPWWFWLIEFLFVALLFVADTVSNIVGVKNSVVPTRECGDRLLGYLSVHL